MEDILDATAAAWVHSWVWNLWGAQCQEAIHARTRQKRTSHSCHAWTKPCSQQGGFPRVSKYVQTNGSLLRKDPFLSFLLNSQIDQCLAPTSNVCESPATDGLASCFLEIFIAKMVKVLSAECLTVCNQGLLYTPLRRQSNCKLCFYRSSR